MRTWRNGLHNPLASFKDGAVRGSPLLRTFLVVLCLGLAAYPLWKMTRARTVERPDAAAPVAAAVEMEVPFSLQGSALMRRIVIKDEAGTVMWEAPDPITEGEIHDSLPRLPRSVQVRIEWADPSPAPRYFAKLRLEATGRDTLTHVFDSAAGIDDIWELP
jgi:hypothetical protein